MDAIAVIAFVLTVLLIIAFVIITIFVFKRNKELQDNLNALDSSHKTLDTSHKKLDTTQKSLYNNQLDLGNKLTANQTETVKSFNTLGNSFETRELRTDTLSMGSNNNNDASIKYQDNKINFIIQDKHIGASISSSGINTPNVITDNVQAKNGNINTLRVGSSINANTFQGTTGTFTNLTGQTGNVNTLRVGSTLQAPTGTFTNLSAGASTINNMRIGNRLDANVVQATTGSFTNLTVPMAANINNLSGNTASYATVNVTNSLRAPTVQTLSTSTSNLSVAQNAQFNVLQTSSLATLANATVNGSLQIGKNVVHNNDGITSTGRYTINGPDSLFVTNKGGLTVSKQNAGTGNLTVEGALKAGSVNANISLLNDTILSSGILKTAGPGSFVVTNTNGLAVSGNAQVNGSVNVGSGLNSTLLAPTSLTTSASNLSLRSTNSITMNAPQLQATGNLNVNASSTLNNLSVNGASQFAGNVTTNTGLIANNLSVNRTVDVRINDPGPMIEKKYGNNLGDRYGFGQFPNGTARTYTATGYSGASVNMSYAKFDGTFDDVVQVARDLPAASYKTSVTQGKLCMGSTCINQKDFFTLSRLAAMNSNIR